MNEVNEEILRFEKMISIVVSKYENQFREELKQDLYLYLLNNFQNKNFSNAKNLDNYIFICLKNQAKYEYKSKYCCPIDIVSLDKTNDITGSALINSIPDNRDDGENEEYTYSIPMEELKNRICQICGLGDYEILYQYYVDKVSQKELALELQITQLCYTRTTGPLLSSCPHILLKQNLYTLQHHLPFPLNNTQVQE